MSLSVVSQEKLLRVVRLLESLQDSKFDLRSWHAKGSCGTTYCAMGYAASTEWFRQRGLALDDNWGIRFSDEIGFDAVANFFGITTEQAEYLFLPQDRYSTRQQVINRISKFVVRDGEMRRGALLKAEKTRLNEMLAALDAKLAAEKAPDPAALMRKVMAQERSLVPA